MTHRLLLAVWLVLILVVGLGYWVQLLVLGLWSPDRAGDRLSRIARTVAAAVPA